MLTIQIHERLDEAFSPKTVKIGDTVWMAENLSVDDGGDGIYTDDKGTVYYSRDAAVRIARSISGWHLPDKKEWEAANAKTRDLMSALNIKLNGYYSIGDLGQDYFDKGRDAYFWTPKKLCDDGSWGMYAYFAKWNGYKLAFLTNPADDSGFMTSIRLVKD